MLLIVGLGNPESQYRSTRHNMGFMVLDQVARKLLPVGSDNWQRMKKLDSLVIKKEDFILAKPQVAMNNNGLAVEKVVSYFKVPPASLLIIHDDLDLPLGQMKMVFKRGSAGHRGVESIIHSLGENNFWRLRVGIGRPKGGEVNLKHEDDSSKEVVDYVLAPFDDREKRLVNRVVNRAAKLVVQALEEGAERVKGKYGI